MELFNRQTQGASSCRTQYARDLEMQQNPTEKISAIVCVVYRFSGKKAKPTSKEVEVKP